MNWNHLVFEGFCCRKTSIKIHKHFYEILDDGKTKKMLNQSYDPKYKTSQKPKYCEDEVCYACWENNCEHLGTVPVSEEEYEMFMNVYDEWVKCRKDEKMVEIDEMKDISDYVQKAHEIAFKHGFWEVDKDRNDGELIALMHSELSETLEAMRNRDYDHVGEELADCVIRIFDYCGARNIDLEKELKKKMKINEQRPFKHNKAF